MSNFETFAPTPVRESDNLPTDEFLATVSHELRAPLSAILVWVQLLQHTSDPTRVAEGLGVIERNARAQARLLSDLLDVSQSHKGLMRLRPERMALTTPLNGALEALRPMADSKRITLLVRHDTHHDALLADPERLQQIIWNVLSNAIKFTPYGGSIVTSTSASESAIELRVRDSGVGIDASFLPFVFDRFRQADPRGTHPQEGLGLGLSIVKDLVERHGGTVRVDSAGRGQGTTVVLTFPRSRGR